MAPNRLQGLADGHHVGAAENGAQGKIAATSKDLYSGFKRSSIGLKMVEDILPLLCSLVGVCIYC